MPHTALFVIDIQNDMACNPTTQIPAAERIRVAAKELLCKARAKIAEDRKIGQESSLHLVYVQHEEPPESGPLNRGSKAWELVFSPNVEDSSEQLVSKTTQDTFESNPDLAAELKAMGIEQVVNFGIQSECCVRSTSLGALDAGFDVTLLQGAHSTYDSQATSKSAVDIEADVNRELAGRGAKVVRWENWTP